MFDGNKSEIDRLAGRGEYRYMCGRRSARYGIKIPRSLWDLGIKL